MSPSDLPDFVHVLESGGVSSDELLELSPEAAAAVDARCKEIRDSHGAAAAAGGYMVFRGQA